MGSSMKDVYIGKRQPPWRRCSKWRPVESWTGCCRVQWPVLSVTGGGHWPLASDTNSNTLTSNAIAVCRRVIASMASVMARNLCRRMLSIRSSPVHTRRWHGYSRGTTISSISLWSFEHDVSKLVVKRSTSQTVSRQLPHFERLAYRTEWLTCINDSSVFHLLVFYKTVDSFDIFTRCP